MKEYSHHLREESCRRLVAEMLTRNCDVSEEKFSDVCSISCHLQYVDTAPSWSDIEDWYT